MLDFELSYQKDGSWQPSVCRDGFLIIRCRPFLSLRPFDAKVSDCTPASGERELGLVCRETGGREGTVVFHVSPAAFWNLFCLVRFEMQKGMRAAA